METHQLGRAMMS